MDSNSVENGRILYMKVINNVKYDLKQDIISCGLVSSLKQFALTNLAISLWQVDLRYVVEQFIISNQNNINKIFFGDLLAVHESNILARVSFLILPLPFKEELKQLITNYRYDIINLYSSLFKTFTGYDVKELFLIFCSNICFTPEFRINALKSVVNVIDNSNLGTIDKYILACNCCLEDKIQILLKKLPVNLIFEVIKSDNGKSKYYKKYILVTFWTYFMKNKKEKFFELIIGQDPYEYMLQWSMIHNNYLAWHFFWENIADEAMKTRNINYQGSCSKFATSYLLTKWNHSKLENFLNVKDVSSAFANMLNRISKTCKVALISYYVLDFIKTNKIFDSFELIIHCRMYDHFSTIEYIRIWEEFTIHFKDKIKNYYDKLLNEQLLVSLLDNDWQTAKFLINMGTYDDIKIFLNGKRGFEMCTSLISVSPDLFEKSVKLILVSEEEVSNYKKYIFSDIKFLDLYLELIIEDKFEIFKDILCKFCTTEEICRYKSELPFKNNADLILFIINRYVLDDSSLNMINKFISWCYEENEEDIVRCKAMIFDFETQLYVKHKEIFFNKLSILINKEKWEYVEKFWRWIFFATKIKICTPVQKFNRIKKILYQTSQNKYCTLIKKFITSCFKHFEIENLKEELKERFLSIVVRDLLNIDSHEELNNILDWCFSSDKKEINKFKVLFMSVMGCKLLFKLIKYGIDMVKVKRLFEWFKPSIQSANTFKKNFLNYIINKKKIQWQYLKRSEKLTKKNFKIWDIIEGRAIKSLSLLPNYIEEEKTIEEECHNWNGNKRKNEKISYRSKKKVKI